MPREAESKACIWRNAPGLTDRLIALHNSPENLSFGEIANRLNQEFPFKVSRSGCIAKARRLALPAREKETVVRSMFGRRALARGKNPSSSRSRKKVKLPSAPELPPRHLFFDELRSPHCRFPFGRYPAITFCGLPHLEGSSFCPFHYRITHRGA